MTNILARVAELAGYGAKAARVAAWLQRFGYWKAAAEQLGDAFRDQDWTAILRHAADLARKHQAQDVDSLIDVPRCGCSDYEMLREDATLAQWPRGHVVNVHLADPPQGNLTPSDWADVFRDALTSWSDVCGLRWQLVQSKPPHGLSVFSENEDGPSKTLAWCELPTAGVRLYRMKIDESERWVRSGNGIIAQAVIAHELGHGIGISHIAANAGRALMNPMYNSTVIKPLALDIEQARLRYGEPAAAPPSTPIGKASAVVTLADGRTIKLVEAA